MWILDTDHLGSRAVTMASVLLVRGVDPRIHGEDEGCDFKSDPSEFFKIRLIFPDLR